MKLFKMKNKTEIKRTGVLFFDNGTTGTVGWLGYRGESEMVEVPVKKRASFHKSPRSTTVIDVKELERIIRFWMYLSDTKPCNVIAYRERPMINPKRWQASMSASRADEAETIMLEQMGIKYHYVDSKAWQRHILPSSGKRGTTSEILKAESKDIGLKMFKSLSAIIEKHGDADGILGAFVFSTINDEYSIVDGVPNWKLQFVELEDGPEPYIVDTDHPEEEKPIPNLEPNKVKDEGEARDNEGKSHDHA